MFFLPTLDWSATILWLKSSMNFLHSVIFNVKMGSGFSLFSATSLIVSKIDPAMIVSSRRIFEMLPLLSPSILYHHILTLLRLRKHSASALQNSWHPGYGEKNCSPLLIWPDQVSSLFVVVSGLQIYKNWTSNGGDNWGLCCKKWQDHSFLSYNSREAIAEN